MKRGWLTLTLLLVMLCRCEAAQVSQGPPSDHTLTETTPTQNVGVCESLQAPTQAPLCVYPLEETGWEALGRMGEEFVLFSGGEQTRLCLLSGSDGRVIAQAELPCAISLSDSATVLSAAGMCCIDREREELVFLDGKLTQTQRIALPEESQGGAVSEDFRYLYYCTAEGLLCLELQTGMKRLVREMHNDGQRVTGLLWGDSVVRCEITEQSGIIRQHFYSAQDGQLLETAEPETQVWTCEDVYMAVHMDGAYRELLWGSVHFGPSVLVPAQEADQLFALPVQDRLLLCTEEAQGAAIDCYDLTTGCRESRLLLPEGTVPVDAVGSEAGSIWLLCRQVQTGREQLLIWQPEAFPAEDPTVYLQNRRTRELPDTQGLLECAQLAAQIGEKHHVRILLDVTQPIVDGYCLTEEYQVPLLRRQLALLNAVLSAYPPGFWQSAMSETGGTVQIRLVRQILDKAGNRCESYLYWTQDADAELVIAAGAELAQQLHRGLFPVIDSRVRSRSGAYDQWQKLNPRDFRYGTRTDSEADLIEEYFTGEAATVSAAADRGEVMVFALQSGQEALFSSAGMQAKLRQLCIGIREAFQLEPGSYLWEQYLLQPLPDK